MDTPAQKSAQSLQESSSLQDPFAQAVSPAWWIDVIARPDAWPRYYHLAFESDIASCRYRQVSGHTGHIRLPVVRLPLDGALGLASPANTERNAAAEGSGHRCARYLATRLPASRSPAGGRMAGNGTVPTPRGTAWLVSHWTARWMKVRALSFGPDQAQAWDTISDAEARAKAANGGIAVADADARGVSVCPGKAAIDGAISGRRQYYEYSTRTRAIDADASPDQMFCRRLTRVWRRPRGPWSAAEVAQKGRLIGEPSHTLSNSCARGSAGRARRELAWLGDRLAATLSTVAGNNEERRGERFPGAVRNIESVVGA